MFFSLAVSSATVTLLDRWREVCVMLSLESVTARCLYLETTAATVNLAINNWIKQIHLAALQVYKVAHHNFTINVAQLFYYSS